MTIDFYNAHIETICELETLAKNHNCTISFGVRSTPMSADTIDEDLLVKHFKCPKEIAQEICEKCSFEIYSCGDSFYIYFELKDYKDVTKPIYNILENTLCEFSFTISIGREELSEDALEWLKDNSMNDDWGYDGDEFIMCDDYSNENVIGFKGVEKDSWSYRTGIIVGVFSNLVCDYLGEERIKRTY